MKIHEFLSKNPCFDIADLKFLNGDSNQNAKILDNWDKSIKEDDLELLNTGSFLKAV